MKIWLVALPFVIGAIAPASATVTLVESGTVAAADGDAGLFGMPDSDTAGLAYRIVYRFSGTPAISYARLDYATQTVSESWATARVTIKIGGQTITRTASGNQYDDIGQLLRTDAPDDSSQVHSSFQAAAVFPAHVDSISTSLQTTNFAFSVNDLGVSAFEYDVRSSDTAYSTFSGSNYYYDLAPSQYILTNDALSVPEAASWALMVGGFAGSGAMIRRRRRISALAG